jgi:hypothetical protein
MVTSLALFAWRAAPDAKTQCPSGARAVSKNGKVTCVSAGPAEATTVSGSKSNHSERVRGGGGKGSAGSGPAESATVNVSKSNTYRQGSATSGGGAGKTTGVNTSKTNNLRQGSPKGGTGPSNRWPGATLNH